MSIRKILVLDADLPPALTVVRSLAHLGLNVDIASHIDKPLAGYSRHARLRLRYPDPMQSPKAFIDWLNTHATDDAYELIIPITERTAVPLMRLRDQVKAARIALPSNDSLEVALDKAKTVELARQLGIPVPESTLIAQASALDSIKSALVYPVVIKPARSMGTADQGIVQLGVDYAFNESELIAKARHALRFGNVILQEYFAGQGVGIELIADHGKIMYAFQHLRLHEVPLTGGGSSLRQSVTVEPELLEASRKLMASLDWHGIAMVEFKWDPKTRDFRLMEINGRFWGSLPLAVAAGADFPAMLYELLVNGKIRDRKPPKLGVLCRKLSSDLYWHEQVIRGATAPAKLTPPLGRNDLWKSVQMLFNPKHRLDIQTLSDPVPGLVDIGQILAAYWKRALGIAQDRRLLRRQRAAWQSGHVANILADAKHILFICYGNINRSSLAERYYLNKANGTPAFSAGFHPHDGRPADPNMVEVARRNGLDMDNWSSRQVDHRMADQADLIFVMEAQHFKRIAEEFPEAASKTFLLGLADEQVSPDGEIADPYGKSPEHYERCFEQVNTCVDRIIEIQSSAQRIQTELRT